MTRLALGLLVVGLVVACGDSHDTRTHRGFVEYQCQFHQEEVAAASFKPELRPVYEARVEKLCADLRQSRTREEAVQVYQEADPQSWYRVENMDYGREPWSDE